MNPKHVHTPASTRARCPVCHQAVYSRGGIHPQCAVKQSEPPKIRNKPTVLAPTDDPALAVASGIDLTAAELAPVSDPPDA